MPKQYQKPVAARGAGAVRATAARGETGAPPSNTAPSQYKGEPIQILRQGIDSLYVSYPGQITETWDKTFSQLKALSASRDKAEQAAAIAEIGDLTFHVRDKGARNFKYVLNHPDYHLQVSSHKSTALPLTTVRIASACLTQMSPGAALKRLSDTVRHLANGGETQHSISRVDLCVDFAVEWDLLSWDENGWNTRAHNTARYADRGRGTGWTVGAGGEISFRLYDKTEEIATKSTHRTDVHELWFEKGWNGVDAVYRAEFQLKREPLKGLGVSDYPSLQPLIGPIWGYLCRDWVRLVVPSPSDTNRSRWPLHPVWSTLAELSWPDSGTLPISRSRPQHSMSETFAIQRLRGALTSYMAINKVSDSQKALGAMYSHLLDKLASLALRKQDRPEGMLFDEASAKATKAGEPFESARKEAANIAEKVQRGVYQKQVNKWTPSDDDR